MKPEQLEEIVMGFINHDYDVLLSTTIVENGIDIPNANTIIINDAHRFGLSDLHQMRGRVGRSNRKAFCYLLSPPLSVLSADARRRLEALETFSDLGSGFALAVQDLDIRGAGNLLGAEQSGFMEDLGYETYLKILKEAMAELRNEQTLPVREESNDSQETKPRNEEHVAKPSAPLQGESLPEERLGHYVSDCSLESDLEMYFPDTYVPGSSERMLLYRELDNIENDRELEAYRQRLIDRFGTIPHEGEELMRVVSLRRLGKLLGCEKIILKQGRMQLQLVRNADSPYYQSAVFGRIIDYMMAHPKQCMLKEVKGRRMAVVTDVQSVSAAVDILQQI
jgi:transcription-repair coupling factor (superfamily II helicase)